MSLPKQIRLAQIAPVSAIVEVPGSKSITNRAFLIAALAKGKTKLHGALESDDTQVMSKCLAQLGVTVQTYSRNGIIIDGTSGQFQAPSAPLFVNNSGTTIRFLTAASALTPVGSDVVLDGVERMRQRPIVDLVEALLQLGVPVKAAASGCPPVSVVGGGIRGGSCLVKGTLSSQYLSALLIASPYSSNDVTIVVDGELVSKPYVDMTLSMMSTFGVKAENHGYRLFTIPSCQKYIGRDYAIEPDASNASYFLAAAAVTGGQVTVTGLGTNSIQGDIAFADVLEQMGCSVSRSNDSFTVTGPQQLLPVDFDASSIPDMAQTLAVVAAFASGTSRITGLQTLRVKETDRISAMAAELRKIGISVTEGADFLVISPSSSYTPATVKTYEDHRMAMSFAVAGLKIDGLTIDDPSCVAKTFPDFWDRWESAFPHSIAKRN